MFELSIALKYLLPQRKQLSLSIISVISVFVISLVVWLILVFLSVTNGMEKNWIDKLVALNGTIQITPKNAYYQSYYYLSDSLSHRSDYQLKSIQEKLNAKQTDPYDPNADAQLPSYWEKPDISSNGEHKDLVKELFSSVRSLSSRFPELAIDDYETAYSSFNIRLVRTQKGLHPRQNFSSSSLINQSGFAASFSPSFERAASTIAAPTAQDINNFIHTALGNDFDYFENHYQTPDETLFSSQAQAFFEHVTIKELKTPQPGWLLPYNKIQNLKEVKAIIVGTVDEVEQIMLPCTQLDYSGYVGKLRKRGLPFEEVFFSIKSGEVSVKNRSSKLLFKSKELPYPVVIPRDTSFKAQLHKDQLESVRHVSALPVTLQVDIQGQTFSVSTFLGNLEISEAESINKFKEKKFTLEESPPWPYYLQNQKGEETLHLPSFNQLDDPVFLPKGFYARGVRLGDRGYLSYQSSTSTSVQEQKIPFYVAGFFDPGLAPLGNRLVLTPRYIPLAINNDTGQEGKNRMAGVRVDISDLKQVEALKIQIQQKLAEKGLLKYWKVESYQDFEFSKDFIEQLQSDRTLLSLVAIIIIIVACSNIISMLILLVNDKKVEIGILQSMGATRFSIGLIFGTCGIVLGLLGSLIGTVIAFFTLKNFHILVAVLSQIQGHDAFNATFYGDSLPNDMSIDALYFVLITTSLLSLIAGIVPAIKAGSINPSKILRQT